MLLNLKYGDGEGNTVE